MEGMAADESLGAVVALQQQQRWLQYSPVLTGSEFSATSSVPHAQFPNQKALGSIPGSSSDAFQSQQMSRSYDNFNHPFYQRLLSSLDSTLASPDPLLYSSASNSLSSLYSSPTIRKDREEHQHAISNMRSSSLYPFAVNKADILLEDCSFDQSFHISLSSMKVPSCSQADHSVAQNISICAPLAGKVVNPSNDTGPQQLFVSSSVSAPLAGKVVSPSNDTGPQQVFASSSVSAPEKKASSPDPTADSFTNSIHQISKKRKVQQKRIVCVPLTTGTGRASGEGLSTADTWSWRKYGQKPIKGSPYPRGYYRCSSYKGCPARKQVERSRTDPSMLIIAYSSDHNHSSPARRAASHQSPLTMANDQLTVTSSDQEEAAATASGHPSEALFCSIINSNSSKDSSCATMKTAINPELPVFNNQDCTGDLKKMNVSSGSCSSCNMSTQAEEDNFFSELEELPDSSEIFGSVQLLNDGSAAQDHEASGRQLAATDHLYNLLCWSSACSSSI